MKDEMKYTIQSDVEFKKDIEHLEGYTSAILFRGVLTIVDTAILSASSTVLVMGTREVALAIGSGDVLKGIITGAFVAASTAYVAPRAVKNIGAQVSAIKEYRRMQKILEEQCNEYASRIVNEEDQKRLTK